MPIIAPDTIKISNIDTLRHGEKLHRNKHFFRFSTIEIFLRLLKKCFLILSIELLLSVSSSFSALCSTSDPLIEADRLATIDFLIDRAINAKLIRGAVVLIGSKSTILHTTIRGNLTENPLSTPLTTETLFDVASLTKVLATTPAIMKLLEQGDLSLLDPITRWFPELEDSIGQDITILNLMTHTSGLHDVSIATPAPMETLLLKTAIQPEQKSPNRFLYADINFMLLAELVQRVTKVPFNDYCQEYFYKPMGMTNTTFTPLNSFRGNIAPTRANLFDIKAGIVQDENAQLLGGVAGHAGLFSSATDISKFITMILADGVQNNKEILKKRTVTQMISPYFFNSGRVTRGLGWDIHSPYSSPRSHTFSPMSFGHTGYSGSSIWVDAEHDLYVVLLTIRLDYQNKQRFNKLRNNISTMASLLFSKTSETEKLLENRTASDLLKP